jgi:hypothetical protein
MKLRLPYPPAPEYAAQHAEVAVSAARKVDAIDLNYSPDSLKLVDAIVCDFHQRGVREEQIAATLFSLGCYVGEVMVRTLGGGWHNPADTAIPKAALEHFPFIVVVTGSGAIWSPIPKIFKLFDDGGPTESVYFLWQTARG